MEAQLIGQGATSRGNNGEYLQIFQDWIQKLQDSLRTVLPTLPDLSKSAFCAACYAVQISNQARMSAIAVKEALAKLHDPPATAQELADADKAIADATAAQDSARKSCQSISAASLLPGIEECFLSADYDDSDLVTYTVLTQGTAQGLADWCEASPEQADQLMTALKDTALLRLFLQSGGARNGKYGPAVQGYRRLTQSSNVAHHAFLHDLALATSLELADPYDLFNQRGKTDIVMRYTHYEQAYLLGELDPHFNTLNVWELRQVVNSDATEDELSWGRRSLEAYRPDICLWSDEQWSYCEVVKTDVAYKNPDFYKEPRSYDQILSGGGECGPRAWYGRFICKAFGIPTWGVRQEGHAAMSRWTPHNGWITRFGAGFAWAWWDDQGGLDFLLETQARTACGSLENYAQLVLRLQWTAAFNHENEAAIRKDSLPDGKSPWYSLGMMQRIIIAAQQETTSTTTATDDATTLVMQRKKRTDDPCVEAKIQRIRLHKQLFCKAGPPAMTDHENMIVIPAATCSSPTTDTSKVMFLPSFLGGLQLFVKEDAAVEYTLPESCVGGSFRLSLVLATAHRFEQNVTVVCGDDETLSSYVVPMKYTMALWGETEAVVVIVASTKFVIRRPAQLFGFSLSEIRLARVDEKN